jgi:hypothetical protein
MPKGIQREIIPASKERVFALVHDYEKRLEWDTLLHKACLEPEFPAAGVGAISVCQGRFTMGGLSLRTVYVTFQEGRLAAVKMLNRPPFFGTFAASIRHFDVDEESSEIVYEFHFTARPAWAKWILHPVMSLIFGWETKKRLKSLKRYVAEGKNKNIPTF